MEHRRGVIWLFGPSALSYREEKIFLTYSWFQFVMGVTERKETNAQNNFLNRAVRIVL